MWITELWRTPVRTRSQSASLRVDPVSLKPALQGWIADIAAVKGAPVEYPIISDPKREIAVQLGMLDEEEKDNAGIPATVRKVFVIGPDRKIKLQLIYPTAVGRNFDEIIRVIDALQLAAKYPIATPVNWTKGKDVMIQPTVSDADAEAKFPGFNRTSVPSGKGYIRFTKDPSA